MLQEFELFNGSLQEVPPSKKLIATLNAHSFNTVKKDSIFREALRASDMLLPDGISVVLAVRLLQGKKIRKIAGDDLFHYEMQRVHQKGGKCFFLGSSETTLDLIEERAKREFPGLQIYHYSPPYKPEFTEEENRAMIDAVNVVEPDVLFVGMTAPKQEKWAFEHFDLLRAVHICCIGAVFDFYAGTVQRAPAWMITAGMEWFYRLVREPRRMWRRYLIGNTLFVSEILKEKFRSFGKGPRLVTLQSKTVKPEQN
ncbi:WecB/TagA/CpsF family glycosyltransferase [uncultured Proteiniphilum sp.]|uniref:WecB/TagA/CpsF family glycosyltransferase n=1 Tax=uncultured Proteiniphilum sp. TaxID=497637 RepID=UPI002616F1EF|nr:WecB/TagA/CpsF family glycosyltransferase [uncultured Proteiniphilum sp.]